MYNSDADFVEALASGPDIFSALLDGCTQEQAASARGGDENWSVIEVMCHLRDAEERALERMRLMRDRDDPPVAGYDQEAWARERNYAAADLRDAYAAFLRFRHTHVTELATLSPEQWQRPGRHEKHGPITIQAHTLHMIFHDLIHAAQIARQLQTASA